MLYLCERFFSFLFVAMTYDIFRLLCTPHAKYVFIFVVISNFCGKVKKKYSGKKKLFSAPTPGPQIISAPPAPQHYLLFYSPFCVFRLYDTVPNENPCCGYKYGLDPFHTVLVTL